MLKSFEIFCENLEKSREALRKYWIKLVKINIKYFLQFLATNRLWIDR